MSEFIIYIFLLSLWNLILFYGNSYGMQVTLFMIPLLIYIYYFLKKNKKINNKYGLLFMIPIVLLSLTYFIYDNSTFSILNKLVIFILFFLMYIFTINPSYKLDKIFTDGVTLVFAPIACIGKFFKEVGNKISINIKLSNKTKKVLKSLLIVLPVVIIVLILLSSADMIFDDIFSSIFRKIGDLFRFRIFNDLISKIIYTLIIFTVIGVDSIYLLRDYNKENIKVKESKTKDLFTIKLLVSILNIIYIIFDFIQIKSLLLHHVSSGFNYATYARQGFFELLVVSVINISIILISKNMQNKDNEKEFKFINIMSIIMVFLTIIIIISSFMRMNLYENAYGYTMLRLLVYVTLITEGILMIPTVMYIFNPKFNIVKSYMIILISVYTIITFMNFDYLIAERNIYRYYNDNKIDIEYLENSANDNIPLLVELYNKTENEKIKLSLESYFSYMKSSNDMDNVFEYNLSKDRAYKELKKINIKEGNIKGSFYGE